DISKLFQKHSCFPFRRNRAPEAVLKNTAKAVIVPLRDGFSSLNRVYEGLMGDVDSVTGQSSNYDYIREQIVQTHQNLQRSEQVVSSGLESLDESLERLVQDEGKLECKMKTTEQTLESLRLKQESKEKLLSESQGALEQARENLNSSKQTLEEQEARKYNAEVITGIGAGLLIIPVIGWIA
ncbi:cancer-associated 1 protein-like isoform X2, partial [Clarias magur]